jgi:hypothetical protein
MKKITFKAEDALDQTKMLAEAISSAPDNGYTIDQVRMGIKVLDKIEQSQEGQILLEDAEHAFVLERVRAIKWRVATPGIVSFYEAVSGAQSE